MAAPESREEYLEAITADPESDELRLAYAEHIRPYDGDRAAFVELQIARAQRRRTKKSLGGPGPEEKHLFASHRLTWGRQMAMYTRAFEFDRGFITSISIDPHLFLEHGAWLMKNEPIRCAGFVMPEEGDFPLEELLDSPLLERLDAITFYGLEFTDREIERIAASPHLTRCVWLDLTGNPLGLQAFAALARSPALRNLLYVERRQGGWVAAEAYHPGQEFLPTEREDRWGAPIWEWGPVSPEGQELERQHGYLPWLHHENGCDKFDARWYLDQGILPVRPPGSPVDAD
jgi:uncharacterized protein (TIGR02996 family)